MADATDHDQLFKAVVREFFPDFLRLFFPADAARFDLSAVTWLDKELFAHPPDGPKHILDLVAELRRADGLATSLALVHVEIESADSVTGIEERLPDYYFHLRRTQQKPVLPVVVFLKVGLNGIGVREVTDEFAGEPILTLRYRYVGLPGLPAEAYLRGDNWLGVALSALMGAPREQRLALGVEAMQRLGDAPLSDGRKALLGDCVETYIDIPNDASKQFQDILDANATGRVPAMHKTRVQIASEKAREEGRQEGRQVGWQESEQRTLRTAVTELLEARFGPVPSAFVGWVASVTDTAELRRIHIAAGTAATFDEFRAAVGF